MHIRIVSPAGSIKPRLIDNGAQTLKSWGHKVTVAAHAKGSYGRFSGTPQERAQDLLDALEDKDVDIIWCSRGGYGCMQIPSSDIATSRRSMHFGSMPASVASMPR